MNGKLLGIDHGIKRIGIAVSDASGLVARELTIIKRKSKDEDFERINRIALEQKVVAFVVGVPDNDSKQDAYSQADTVRRWIEHFATTTTLPIILWDEQLSSIDAQELARQQRRKPSEPIDDLAARIILQSYLDAVRDGLAAPEIFSSHRPTEFGE
jgi:putative Holliday junction resolvase